MLVLSRAVGEKIAIGDEIYLCILAVNGTSVRFGVEAPRHISINRAEVYERIQAQLAQAQVTPVTLSPVKAS